MLKGNAVFAGAHINDVTSTNPTSSAGYGADSDDSSYSVYNANEKSASTSLSTSVRHTEHLKPLMLRSAAVISQKTNLPPF